MHVDKLDAQLNRSGSRRRVRRLVAATTALLVGSGVAVGLTSAQAPALVDEGTRPGYHYAAAYAHSVVSPASGFGATLTVHRPKDVRRDGREHSLGQIGVGSTNGYPYVEAGWRLARGTKPRLFVYWRPQGSGDTCYNLGCGFKLKGPGKRPGSKLRPGSTITVAFEHVGSKWWLLVNGKRSGFYPDRLWKGQFTATDFAQAFGEVHVPRKRRVCADMGNGKPPGQGAASVTNAYFSNGVPVVFTAQPYNDTANYGFALTGPDSFEYGGPGAC